MRFQCLTNTIFFTIVALLLPHRMVCLCWRFLRRHPKHHALCFLPKAETYKNCTTSCTKTHHTWRHRKRLPVLLSGYVETRLPHFFRTFPRKASHCTAWNWRQGLPQNVFCTSLLIRTEYRFPVQHVQRPETSSPSPQCPGRLYRIAASNTKDLSSVFHAYMKNAAASFFSRLSEESLELYNFKLTSRLDSEHFLRITFNQNLLHISCSTCATSFGTSAIRALQPTHTIQLLARYFKQN